MSTSPMVVGAGVTVFLNGRAFGNAIDFTFNVSTQRNQLYGIDVIGNFENALTNISINGSLSLYRLRQDGGAEGAGFTVTMPELSRESYFSLLLVEQASGTILFESRRCSLESQSWRIATKSYVIGNLSWVSSDYSNEVRPL